MNISQLALWSVSCECGYQFDSVNIMRVPDITIAVSDDSVVQAAAYRLDPGKPTGNQALPAREKLRHAQGQRSLMKLMLV